MTTNQRGLELRLLGSFRAVAFPGAKDVTPRGKKARALLAYVALSKGGRVTREKVAGLLWSDRGGDQARVSLRQSLAELRSPQSWLADFLAADRETIAIDLGQVRTDVDLLFSADDDQDPGEVVRHLEGYDGEFLDDLDGLSPAFDEWLVVERPRRRDLLIDAALRRATIAFERGDGGGSRAILAELERIDPGNEQVARLGMKADRLTGDLASLHRRYRRLGDVLKHEFDARPSDDTRQLFFALTQISNGVDAAPARADLGAPKAAFDPTTIPVVIVPP